jgi:hypothetical protein
MDPSHLGIALSSIRKGEHYSWGEVDFNGMAGERRTYLSDHAQVAVGLYPTPTYTV